MREQISVHLEAIILDKDKRRRRWQSLVQGFDLQHTLEYVLLRHDSERSDNKHRIMRFWESRVDESPLNKILLRTMNGDVQLKNDLDTDLDILYRVNGGSNLIRIFVRMEIACPMAAAARGIDYFTLPNEIMKGSY